MKSSRRERAGECKESIEGKAGFNPMRDSCSKTTQSLVDM